VCGGHRGHRHLREVGDLLGNRQAQSLGRPHHMGRVRELGDAQFKVVVLSHLGHQASLDLAQPDLFLGHVGLGPGHDEKASEDQYHGDDNRGPQ